MPTHKVVSSDLITTTLSNPTESQETWKYAVEAYTFGETPLSDVTDDEFPTVGEFGGHLLTFREHDGEYVASCCRCARRVEVGNGPTAAQRRTVSMYAIGHFLNHKCDEVDVSEVEEFYIGKMASNSVIGSLKNDLTKLLNEDAEVLRHGQA